MKLHEKYKTMVGHFILNDQTIKRHIDVSVNGKKTIITISIGAYNFHFDYVTFEFLGMFRKGIELNHKHQQHAILLNSTMIMLNFWKIEE